MRQWAQPTAQQQRAKRAERTAAAVSNRLRHPQGIKRPFVSASPAHPDGRLLVDVGRGERRRRGAAAAGSRCGAANAVVVRHRQAPLLCADAPSVRALRSPSLLLLLLSLTGVQSTLSRYRSMHRYYVCGAAGSRLARERQVSTLTVEAAERPRAVLQSFATPPTRLYVRGASVCVMVERTGIHIKRQ